MHVPATAHTHAARLSVFTVAASHASTMHETVTNAFPFCPFVLLIKQDDAALAHDDVRRTSSSYRMRQSLLLGWMLWCHIRGCSWEMRTRLTADTR